MKNLKKRQAFKHFLYVLLFLVIYVLQITPRLFVANETKPFLLIAAAVVIAMFEGEFIGGIYGAFGGLLCDAAATSLFGFNGLLLCLLCVGIGLLSTYLMQPHIGNCLLFVALTTFVIRNLQFLFTYGIYRYQGINQVYTRLVLIATLLTVLSAPVFYFLFRSLHRAFETTS